MTRAPRWIRSSASNSTSGGDCVEVCSTPDGVLVRDSKHPALALRFPRDQWEAFLATIPGHQVTTPSR
ncbi:DUF397 domain-containing protein [Lentzea sp. NBC_00516]|uniref:DUF397 domain-containing protein n=1 Tax=Lentzea sp. NBC_00516 TaxID=2903582 RepID=UPI002E81CC50|nr:DUF397 domain-containing protein [Lentzea sp. NBC_00516]WUD26465.1 DUF397 domain-containing protein [Lentzea sp. NBC_00516]